MSVSLQHRSVRSITAAIIASLTAVFVMDLFMPLDVRVGVPYVAVVLLSLWLPNRRHIFHTAALITVLAIIGIFSPLPERDMLWMAVLNRSIVLFVVWVTAVLGNLLVREQEATRQERDFSESLVETASSIILLLDTDARIIYFNQSTSACLGYQLGEVSGRDWFETCVPEQDRPRARGIFRECAENGTSKDAQFSVALREGQEFQFSWSTKPMQDAEHVITRLLFVGQDITSLLEAQRRLVATERLAAIGQTIAAISHESRNELMALKMGIEMLSATITDPPARHLIEHLDNSQNRLHRLLEDVRHYAGPLHLEQSVCSLREVWHRAWDSLAATRQDRESELHETVNCPSLDCSVDALRIEQVFRNLFENSLAACSDPVWIEIHATQHHQDGRAFLRISVRDNGPGLSPEAKAKVFEPFFTTKQRGTGLGMAISQRILKAHGGELSLAENSKRAAEFLLLIPFDRPAGQTDPAHTAT